MRTFAAIVLLVAFVTVSAFGQSGPGKETKPKKKKKADTTAVEKPVAKKPVSKTPVPKKTEPPVKAPAKADKPKVKVPPPKTEPKPKKSAVPEIRERPVPATVKAPPSTPPPSPLTATKVPMSMVPVESDHIPRAIFTTAIAAREPVDQIDTLTTTADHVYFFTQVMGLKDSTITHRWIHRDRVRAEIPVSIGGPHWRTYTRKKLRPDWAGRWTVEVVTAGGRVLVRKSFVYR